MKYSVNIYNSVLHYKLATNLQLQKHTLTLNNNDFIIVQRLVKETLEILEEIPASKRAISAACVADFLSLSRPQRGSQQTSPGCGTFHVAGGTIDLFIHGTNRITKDHLAKTCVEIIRQWHNTAAHVRKCRTGLAYSLAEENLDTSPEQRREFHVSASNDMANCRDTPLKSSWRPRKLCQSSST